MIRDPAYAGAYDAYAYSQDQAEALRTKLIESGITKDVTIVPAVEAGLLDIVRPTTATPGHERPVDTRTLEERREDKRVENRVRQEKKRAADREEKARNGTLRGRGRPRKQPASSPMV
ncbi:hypothetical protein [Methylobacterium nodulans]|uniref:hypothetical protein n=1 Tax=Methylobacterium nodulans TaxID=114616 RepID=UPI0002FDA056|nr:hypothetical protein [Methylobacterium nodulans]